MAKRWYNTAGKNALKQRRKEQKMSLTIDSLVLEVENSTAAAEAGFDRLIKKMEKLRQAAGLQLNYSGLANGLREVAKASNDLPSKGLSNLAKVGDAFKGLKNVKLGGIASDLQKLPEAMQKFNEEIQHSGLDTFTGRMAEIRESVAPVAADLRTIRDSLDVVAPSAKEATDATKKFANENKNLANTLKGTTKRLLSVAGVYVTIREAWKFAANSFNKSNEFVESINLANVAMGEGAGAALEYAEQVERVAKLDMSKWVENVGVFNQMLAGFGISQKDASHMSQQLTQLGYDIQSAFNVKDISLVMGRLQSGISGQIRGMRAYGVELSVAAMKEFALSQGIEKNWLAMSQAEKATLRYAKIMADTRNIQGDLARTIETPANSLRILSAQWSVATRYIGQFVSVIATKLIPIVQGAVSVISSLAQTLASAWGYVLPDIPATGYVGGLEDVEDAIDGVGGAASGAGAAMKGMLANFDELNVIQSQSGGGGGAGASAVQDAFDFAGLTDYSYNFLDGIKDKTQAITNTVKTMIPWLSAAAGGFASWVVTDKILDFLDLVGVFKDVTGTGLAWKVPLAISGIVTGFMLESMAAESLFANNKVTLESLLHGALGFAVTAGTTGLALGSAGIGVAIASAITITAVVNEFRLKQDRENKAMAAEAFAKAMNGDFSVSEVIKAIQERFAEITGEVPLVVQVRTDIEDAKNSMKTAMETIQKLDKAVFVEGMPTEEERKEFKAAWDDVASAFNSITSLEFDSIFSGLVTAAKNANTEIATEAQALKDTVLTMKADMMGVDADLYKEMQGLMDRIMGGSATAGEFDRYAQLAEYFTSPVEGIEKEMDFMERVASVEGLKLETLEDAKTYIDGLTTSYTDYADSIKQAQDAYASDISAARAKNLKRYQLGAITEEQYRYNDNMLSQYLTVSIADMESRLADLQAESSKAINDLLYRVMLGGAWDADDIETGAANAYVNEYVKPIFDEVRASGLLASETLTTWEGVLAELSESVRWSETAAGKKVAGKGTLGAYLLNQSSRDVTEQVKSKVEALRLLFADDPIEVPITTEGVLAPDVLQEVEVIKQEIEGLTQEEISKMLKDGSIQLPDSLINEALNSYWADERASILWFANETSQAAATIDVDVDTTNLTTAKDAIDDFVSEASKTINDGFTFNFDFTVKPGQFGAFTVSGAPAIPQYAGGGFPATGSLFIANESGPELVGQFGGSTAVANSGQIVAGIAAGVAEANSAQMRLLSQQNALLEKQNNILLNGFAEGLNVKPSVGFGQAAKRSLDMFSKSSGVGW